MASPFDALDAEMSSVVAAEFGETAHIIPRRVGQYAAPGSDGERPPVAALVVLSISPVVDQLFAGNTTVRSTIPKMVLGDGEIWMSRAQAIALGFSMAKGDKISFPNREGSPAFQVVAVLTTDMGDVRAAIVKDDAE